MTFRGRIALIAVVAAALAGCVPGSSDVSSDAPRVPSPAPSSTGSGNSDLPTFEQAEALAKMDLSSAASAINMFTFSYEGRSPVVAIGDGTIRVHTQTFDQKVPGDALLAWGSDLELCVEYQATVETQDGPTPVVVHTEFGTLTQPEAGPCSAEARERQQMTFPERAEPGPYEQFDVPPVEGTCFREASAVFPGRAAKQPAWVVVDCADGPASRIVNGGALTEEEFQADAGQELADQLCTPSWDVALEAGAREAWWVMPEPTGWSANQRDFTCYVT